MIDSYLLRIAKNMIEYIFVVLIATVIYVCISSQSAYWKNRNVPYEKRKFFIQNIQRTLSDSLSVVCSDLYRKYGQYRYVGFFFMWRPAIVLRDPELIKDVLVKQYKNYRNWMQVPHSTDKAISLNPFVLHGDEWKHVRSNLSSQFTSLKIKSMLPLMVLSSRKLVEYIKNQNKCVGGALNVSELCLRYALENVYSCAYGLEADAFSGKNPHSLEMYRQIFGSATILTTIKKIMAEIFPILGNIKYTFLGDPITVDFKNMILSALKYREENMIDSNDYLKKLTELKSKQVPDFASYDQLVCHAFTFYLDGTETSSGTFTSALLELAKNPAVQKKVQAEIDGVLEKYNNEITHEAFQELQCLESVIYEALRLHTTIRMIGRVCLEDVVFPPPVNGVDGESVVIQKGTHVFMPVDALHQDATIYEKPTEFDPYRFQDKSTSLTFMGFGDGPKTCLGKPFALAQLKMGLISILSNFTVEVNENVKLPRKVLYSNLFYFPECPIRLNFVNRT